LNSNWFSQEVELDSEYIIQNLATAVELVKRINSPITSFRTIDEVKQVIQKSFVENHRQATRTRTAPSPSVTPKRFGGIVPDQPSIRNTDEIYMQEFDYDDIKFGVAESLSQPSRVKSASIDRLIERLTQVSGKF
jgi:hypothetical protein